MVYCSVLSLIEVGFPPLSNFNFNSSSYWKSIHCYSKVFIYCLIVYTVTIHIYASMFVRDSIQLGILDNTSKKAHLYRHNLYCAVYVWKSMQISIGDTPGGPFFLEYALYGDYTLINIS